MDVVDLLAGIAVLVGSVGIVLTVIPGLAIQVIAVTIWAFEKGTAVGWVVLGLVLALAATATILKFVFPHRRLRDEGVPGRVLFVAMVVAVIGFFVIPVIGAPIGFILTVYVFERIRRGPTQAWPSTKTALKAVLASMGIELAGGFAITIVFFIGVFLT